MNRPAALSRKLVTVPWPAPPTALTLFAAAVAARLVAFLVLYIGSVLTGHNGQVDVYDSVGIDHWAWAAAQQLRQGRWLNLTAVDAEGAWDVGFTYFVALQYVVFGHFPEVPRLVNVALAAFTAPAVYLAARTTVLGEVVARRAGWLTALWPLSAYWAGYDLLKDPLVWFLLALSLMAIMAETRRRYVGLGLASAVPMQLLRVYMGLALYLFMPFAAIVRRDWRGLTALLAGLLLAQSCLMVIGYPPVWSVAPYAGNGSAVGQSNASTAGVAGRIGGLGGADRLATTQVEGAGSNGLAVVEGGPTTLLKRTVAGTLITVLGPRPALKDLIHPTLDTGMYPGLLVWLLLIPFTALGAVRALRTRDRRVLLALAFTASIWLGLALLFGGGAFRQREMAFPSTLLFTALGLQQPLPRNWWWLYSGVLGLGTATLMLRELHFF